MSIFREQDDWDDIGFLFMAQPSNMTWRQKLEQLRKQKDNRIKYELVKKADEIENEIVDIQIELDK